MMKQVPRPEDACVRRGSMTHTCSGSSPNQNARNGWTQGCFKRTKKKFRTLQDEDSACRRSQTKQTVLQRAQQDALERQEFQLATYTCTAVGSLLELPFMHPATAGESASQEWAWMPTGAPIPIGHLP